MYEDDDHKREAVLAGANGYFSKMEGSASLISSIEKLMKGKSLIDEELKLRFQKEK